MQSKHCQQAETLKAWSLGQLPDDESERLSQHIANCPLCEETLAGFDDTADSFVQSVREAGEEGDGTPGPSKDLAEALEQVINPYGDDAAESTSGVLERIRDYELLEPLGHGGMGTVYRARHQSLDRIVAVKLLPGRRLRAPQAVERFRREMKAIGRLNHPSIVRATDAGDVDGTHYLAMDYVHGIDLARLVRLTGPLPVPEACEVIRQAAVALQYAHEQGLIHRDVKPGNLMLEFTASGQPEATGVAVKVMDLGLALFGAASEMIDELTTVGQLMGTLDYMAPEQADSSHTVDATADVYSLGATLFKLLSGHAPYETDEYRTPLKKMKALSLVDVPGIADRCDNLPEELSQLIDRMLSRDPLQRPQSAQEVVDQLQPFCEGHQLQEVLERGMALQERDRAAAVADGAELSHVVSEDAKRSQVAGQAAAAPNLRLADAQPVAAQNGGGRGRRVLTVCAALAGILALSTVI